MAKSKYVLVGKRELTERQLHLLRAAGLSEQVGRVAHVEDVSEVVNMAKERGAVIVANRLNLRELALLFLEAQKRGIEVYSFRTEVVGFGIDESEAEELAKTHGADVIGGRNPLNDMITVSKTTALERLLSVRFETHIVARLD